MKHQLKIVLLSEKDLRKYPSETLLSLQRCKSNVSCAEFAVEAAISLLSNMAKDYPV